MSITRIETDLGGKKLSLETGKLAKQANSVVAQLGDTVVLATVVVSKESRDCDFLPLKVDYDEKYYASGKIKPSPYVKRETRPSEYATLTARFIDRSIRPLFPKSFHNEIQVILTVLSYDPTCSPDIVAAIAANAALSISEAPFDGPVGMIRVSVDENNNLILNPNHEGVREENLPLNLIVSSVRDRVIMLEAGSNELTEDQMYEAIDFGHKANQTIIDLINDFSGKIEKEKIVVEEPEINQGLFKEVFAKVESNIDPIFGNMDKITRDNFIADLKEQIVASYIENLESDEADEKKTEVSEYYDKSVKKIIVRNILDNGKRIGGRGIDDLRTIAAEVGLIPRTHGSALFQRGETQSLTLTTLSGPGSKATIETMEGEWKRRYFHHYNFPPFSVGSISTRRFTGNREIGHGALAEKAILPMLPSEEEFPYTIRVVSEILESNGSSSMAASCASSLSLMAAGVPIKKAVAGVAMGLMVDTEKEESDRDYIVITDLSDLEDFGGYMDFKVAGTADGITAIQVDMKLAGIPMHVVKDAMIRAKRGRLMILETMNAAISNPNSELSQFAPRLMSIKINPDLIKVVIGKGGETINKIIDETGVEIDISDEGLVTITSPDAEGCNKAVEIVRNLTREIKVGEVFESKIVRKMEFGLIVQLTPGNDALCHISELENHRVENLDAYNIGDTLKVKVINMGPQGKVSVSHKQVS